MYARQLPWAEIIPFPADLLLRMPDDGFRYELYQGVLARESMTAPRHGGICHRLSLALGNYALASGFPHAIVQNTLFDITAPDAPQRTVLAPDVAVMRGPEEPAAIPRATPLLAIEVVSELQTLADLQAKAAIYRAAGVDEIWIVDPHTRQVEIQSAQGTALLADDQEITSALLPGFEAQVHWVLDGK